MMKLGQTQCVSIAAASAAKDFWKKMRSQQRRPQTKNSICCGSLTVATFFTLALGVETSAVAAPTDARTGMQLFADHCFSPYMTMVKASELFGHPGLRYDFYDLDPFANGPPSPVTGRAATPDTDRRCEISFDGNHATAAAQAARDGLQAEGILNDAPLPDTHTATPGTELLAARHLNPKRIAVVHVGTRPGPDGVETYLNVERLTPSASQK